MIDNSAARHNMVESQIRPNAVTDVRLLQALSTVPREAFLPADLRALAYMESEIALEQGSESRTPRRLMAPMPQARLLQLAEIDPGDLVLDIGCATGYSTALVAMMAESVVGLECSAALAEAASQALTELEIDNAAIVHGRLEEGYPSEGPFDVIVLNGCVPEVPANLLKQLKTGGRLVAVLSEGEFGQATLFKNANGRISRRSAFDAGAPQLPGFELAKSFAF